MHDVSAKDTEFFCWTEQHKVKQETADLYLVRFLQRPYLLLGLAYTYVYVSYKNICSQLQLLKTEKFTEEKYISLSGNAGEESSSSSGLNQMDPK